MQHPAFTGLKDSARWTYLAMALEAKGRPDFQFPRRTAELYGISERSLRRNVQELEAAGLVDVVASGRITDFLFVGKLHRKTLTYGLYIRTCAKLALPQMRYFLTGYAKLALPRKRKAPF